MLIRGVPKELHGVTVYRLTARSLDAKRSGYSISH